MKKNIFLFAILLLITSCGPTQATDPTTESPNTTTQTTLEPTSSNESLTTTTNPTVTTTPSITSDPTTEVTNTTTSAPTHQHTFSNKYSHDETYHWYSSTCGHPETEEKIKHDFNSKKTESTYEAEGYTTYTCKDCGYSYVGDKTAKLEHKYDSKYSYNSTHHWFACIDKGYETLKKDEEKHDYKVEITDPTYEAGGFTTYTCKKCKYSYVGDKTNALVHNYDTKYSYNETHHWFACLDKGYENLKKDEARHNFKTVVTPSTYEQKGYSTHTCETCKYSYMDSYTDLLKYKIIYHLDGGVNSTSNVDSFTIEEEVILYNPKKDGHAFLGWFDNNGNQIEKIEKGTRHDVELTAKWQYLLTINGDSLTDVDTSYSVTEIKIPDGIKTIGNSAFKGCYFESVIIPSSVTKMEEDAFEDCYYLTHVYYEGTLEQWCNIQFDYVTATPMFYGNCFYIKNAVGEWSLITDLVIPSSVTEIKNYTFSDFDCLQTVQITKNVTKINYFAFRQCNYLNKVTFEEGSKLTTICEMSFGQLATLESISLPYGVTTIETFAFTESEALSSVELPSTVKTIGRGAFERCKSLKTISIPSGITKIVEFTFNECTSLTSISIPSTVTSIEQFAFSNCSSLISFEIPSSVTTIGNYAFYYCSKLASLKIPSSVKTIGSRIVDNSDKAVIYAQAKSKPSGWDTNWNYYDQPVYWGISSSSVLEQDGVQYIVQSNKAVITSCLDTVKDIVIPSTVKINGSSYKVSSVADGAFKYRENINSIILSNNITTIGTDAFYGSSLTSMVIPSSVTTIKYDGCGGMFDVTIYCEASSKPSGWDSDWVDSWATVYWAGSWEYDANGKPIVKN